MDNPPLFPVSLLLEGRPCLVVGGGPVAARKVRTLIRCRAVVTVVSPEVHLEIESLRMEGPGMPGDASVTVLRRAYIDGEAGRYRLVIAATGDREVNRQVFRDAERAGVFVNVADDPEACTFMLPSVVRHDPVTVAVSSGGESPAVSVWLRKLLGGFVGPEHGEIAVILGEARRAIHAEGRSTEGIDWTGLLEGELPSLVREGRCAEARALVSRWASIELEVR